MRRKKSVPGNIIGKIGTDITCETVDASNCPAAGEICGRDNSVGDVELRDFDRRNQVYPNNIRVYYNV